MPRRKSIVAECVECHQQRLIACRGMCSTCYSRAPRRNRNDVVECSVCHEKRNTCAHGVCIRCYNRQVRGRRGNCSTCGEVRALDCNQQCRRCREKTSQSHCATCGRVGIRMHTKDKCERCYNQFWKTRRPPKPCQNCGRLSIDGNRCARCRAYKTANGHERPINEETFSELRSLRGKMARRDSVKAKGFVVCKTCKAERAIAKGYCGTCYNYRARTGRSRPKHLIHQLCTNCGCPIGESVPSGLCYRCYAYQAMFKKPRPQRVWKTVDPWLGWCECSTRRAPVPATHTITIAIGTPDHSDSNRKEQIHVCQACHDIHQAVERGPRSNHRRDSHATA